MSLAHGAKTRDIYCLSHPTGLLRSDWLVISFPTPLRLVPLIFLACVFSQHPDLNPF